MFRESGFIIQYPAVLYVSNIIHNVTPEACPISCTIHEYINLLFKRAPPFKSFTQFNLDSKPSPSVNMEYKFGLCDKLHCWNK